MTRYEIFQSFRQWEETNCQMTKIDDLRYNKFIRSGELKKTHFDYGVGYYDLSLSVFYDYSLFLWSCRTHFGTVGASSFGSWNSFNTKEEAVTLLNELVEVFSTMIECPSQEMLNLKFRELGVSFWIE